MLIRNQEEFSWWMEELKRFNNGLMKGYTSTSQAQNQAVGYGNPFPSKPADKIQALENANKKLGWMKKNPSLLALQSTLAVLDNKLEETNPLKVKGVISSILDDNYIKHLKENGKKEADAYREAKRNMPKVGIAPTPKPLAATLPPKPSTPSEEKGPKTNVGM